MKFLVDQNVRYRAVVALREAGLDVIHTSEIGLSTIDDEAILDKFISEGLILITFDEGFGDAKKTPLPQHHPGVIRLKLFPQSWKWVSERLFQFLQTTNAQELKDRLVILYNNRVRIK